MALSKYPVVARTMLEISCASNVHKASELLKLKRELDSLLCSVTDCITVFFSVRLPSVQLHHPMQREEVAMKSF